MTSHIDAIKKAFEKLCAANDIPIHGALSAEESTDRSVVTISLDTCKIKSGNVTNVWMQVPNLRMDLKNTKFIIVTPDPSYGKILDGQIVTVTDAKAINMLVTDDGSQVHMFPKLSVTVKNDYDSVVAIEAACNPQASNSQATSNKAPSTKNNGAAHTLRIRQPRKLAQSKEAAPKNSAAKPALDDYLKRPANTMYR